MVPVLEGKEERSSENNSCKNERKTLFILYIGRKNEKILRYIVDIRGILGNLSRNWVFSYLSYKNVI